MGIFSSLSGGLAQGGGAAVKSTLDGVGDLATQIRSAITGQMTPAQQMQLQQQAMQLEQSVASAQAQIDQAEAANPKGFVAGWRPAVGWICALAFGLNFLLLPIGQWVVQLFHIMAPNKDGVMAPMVLFQLDITTMLPVLIGMLGLGTMRTVEKAQGVQNNH